MSSEKQTNDNLPFIIDLNQFKDALDKDLERVGSIYDEKIMTRLWDLIQKFKKTHPLAKLLYWNDILTAGDLVGYLKQVGEKRANEQARDVIIDMVIQLQGEKI